VEPPRGIRIGAATPTVPLFRTTSGLVVLQPDIARSTASFGPTWRLQTGVLSRLPGGVQFTASVVGRRGYGLPVAMVQPLGSDVPLPDSSNAALELGMAPVHWDTELRIRKTLMSSHGLELSLVGEAFNLLDVNHGVTPTPVTPVLTSPTVRGGVALGF
jgi:hypothetical protein